MTKLETSYKTGITIILFILFSNSCDKAVDPVLLPEITTIEVSNITESSVLSGGTITSDAGNQITSRGVCWSTNPNPTIADSITKDAAGTGRFVSKINSLLPNTTYYLRAYATNKKGTGYGLQETFTTKSLGLLTKQITEITLNSAKTGGNIEIPGDSSSIIERGICWSTQASPTIQNFKSANGKGTGEFTCTLTELTANTIYYVRAYATNGNGTHYGNEINFKTKIGIVSATTTSATNITPNSATSGGNITEIGGNSVSERGVCWSTSPNPTIADPKSSDGNGVGSFTSSLTGLKNSTKYYVRTYATNIDSTYYGNEVSFNTLSGIITISSTAASNISGTTAKFGGYISAVGGSSIIESGICYSSNINPTIDDNKISTTNKSIGTYSATASGLTPNTTYYFRAYATNSVGLYYGNELSFKTTSIVTDADGNVYNTVTIGTQTWMVENLKTTKYNDGTSIPLVANASSWSTSTTPAYCWYANDAANKNKYGALYNGYAISTGKLAPTGWHIATDAEWTTLENYIGVNTGKSGTVTKALSATTDWTTSTSPGAIGNDLSINNSSGFTALPGGIRDNTGIYDMVGTDCYYWTSTGTTTLSYRNFNYQKYTITKNTKARNFGYSVRCIKD
ncbi:MAG TPA: fibrobacter succinogenes major paralogous domain-containing protein [Paludibacter sp.]